MTFNEEQLTCLEAPESKILVNASAGTGKTTTLIEAARRKTQRADDVIVITFTNAAADEIKSRMKIQPHFVGTIHSFALREIERIAKKHIFKNKIMDNTEIKQLLIQAMVKVNRGIKKGYKEELTRLLSSMTSRTNFTSDSDFHYQNSIFKEYVALKKQYNKYDFTDTPEYLLELMERFKWKLPYKHFFVDEIQDINKHEFNLIASFDGYIFLIGDPQQSIYLFRDSLENVFDKFENLGYNIYILTENYRSYQEILDFAGAILNSVRGYGGPQTITDEKLLIENPNCLILCRTNKEVTELEQYFSNVLTIHAFKGLEADEVVLVDFQVSSQESKNVKFVGLTRAKNRLGITNFNAVLRLGRKLKYGY